MTPLYILLSLVIGTWYTSPAGTLSCSPCNNVTVQSVAAVATCPAGTGPTPKINVHTYTYCLQAQ